jgi:esterase/lipase superfamily enzyme
MVREIMFPRPIPPFNLPRRCLPARSILPLLAEGFLAALLLSSCSKGWQMMPTPLVHQYVGAESYALLPPERQAQDMEVFYATNRPGAGPAAAREYGNGITGEMQLGLATVRFGEAGLNWRELVRLSTHRERGVKVPLDLVGTRELDALPATDGKAFAAEVNRALAERDFPDITLYVHGAKSTFLRSMVQGAQFHHFMARDTVLISYSWPSTGKFLSYDKDVEYAAQSAPALADLLEYLAANTRAKKINVLGYSAGGQVVAPGLALLRARHADESEASLKRRLRIGEVYLAAADVGMKKFVSEYLPAFADIVHNVTITFHRKDRILGFALRAHKGETRLGRPSKGELNEEEIRWVEALEAERRLDPLDMEYSPTERPLDFSLHGDWYLNEWVSSDAILQFLFHDEPDERGLERIPGTGIWYFPPDYPARLEAIVRKGLEERGGNAGHRQ